MPSIIENNPEQILIETIAKYEAYSGTNTYPADVERLLLNVLTYRETLLRALMQRISDQNYPQTAIGSRLDYWGSIIGVERTTDETDENYRIRILAKSDSQNVPVGCKKWYETLIKSINGVSDVWVRNMADGEPILPGVIKLILIAQKSDTRGFNYGDIAISELYTYVLEQIALAQSTETLIGDTFVLTSAAPILINGTIVVQKKYSAETSTVTSGITDAIDRYFAGLSTNFGSIYDAPTLQRTIENVTGVYGLVSSTLSVPVLTVGQFYKKGTINLTVQ